MRRPSPATAISLVALFVALSGSAYAATGGTFLLGKSNTASAVSSLTNTKGTALSLSSTSTTPPLEVSNSVRIPNLNASQLGGIPASGFIQGPGQVDSGGQVEPSGASSPVNIVGAPGPGGDIYLQGACDSSAQASLYISNDTSTTLLGAVL